MKKKNKNANTTMDKLTIGYDKFITGKESNPAGAKLFEKTLKKAIKPRGSK